MNLVKKLSSTSVVKWEKPSCLEAGEKLGQLHRKSQHDPLAAPRSTGLVLFISCVFIYISTNILLALVR